MHIFTAHIVAVLCMKRSSAAVEDPLELHTQFAAGVCVTSISSSGSIKKSSWNHSQCTTLMFQNYLHSIFRKITQ